MGLLNFVWIGWMYNKWMNELRLHSAESSGEWWRVSYESPVTQRFWRNLSLYPIIRREALTKSQDIYSLPNCGASQMGSLSAKLSTRCLQQKKKWYDKTEINFVWACYQNIRMSELVYYQRNSGVSRSNFSLSHHRISFVTTLI